MKNDGNKGICVKNCVNPDRFKNYLSFITSTGITLAVNLEMYLIQSKLCIPIKNLASWVMFPED